MTATVDLKLPHHQYQVIIEPGLLDRLGELVQSVAAHDKAAVMCDSEVYANHGAKAAESMRGAGYDVVDYKMPPGEENKSLDTVRGLYDVLLDRKLERKSPVVAVGGGVTGDMVGFAASSYLRGVPFVQCPTTLLSMVDASVGGKVGVNVPQGKNLVGAFYQPMVVAIDTDTLKTLPPRELKCGLAECVKHGVLRDGKLFDWIEQNLDSILNLEDDTLVELVRWNVQIKADVVVEDEKEAGIRAHLNFGHTFAHAIETTTSHKYHHGEAVALGMVAATHLAEADGRCEAGLSERLVAVLDRIGLPTGADDLASTDELVEVMRLDKKVAGGKIRLVLPVKMGEVTVCNDISEQLMAVAWDSVRK